MDDEWLCFVKIAKLYLVKCVGNESSFTGCFCVQAQYREPLIYGGPNCSGAK